MATQEQLSSIKILKVKYPDGSYSEKIPVSAYAKYVIMDNDETVQDTIGIVNIDADGNLQSQIKSRVTVDEYRQYIQNLQNVLDEMNAAIQKRVELDQYIQDLQSKINQEDLDLVKQDIQDNLNLFNLSLQDNAAKVQILDSRLDNLIVAGSGEEMDGDASLEVYDARTGYNGTVYEVLGDGIRDQIGELHDNDSVWGRMLYKLFPTYFAANENVCSMTHYCV